MKAYNHILSAVGSEIWALQPEKLRAMVGFLQLKAAGREPEIDVLAAVKTGAVEAASRAQRSAGSSTAATVVIPVTGMIMPRGSMVNDISGPSGTSTEGISNQLNAAMGDSGVGQIIVDIYSPGGAVTGVPELAAEIQDMRKQKPIIAVANGLCASAAYWLASACSEIVVTPSSLTGSIGVYTVHEDLSKALEEAGVNTTLIYYGANKVNGHSLGPLTDDARAEMQDRVDYYGDMFDSAVAKGRKVSKADVGSKFGQGKVFNAQKAKSTGMADSIGTMDDVLARFGVSRRPSSGARAAMLEEAPSASGDITIDTRGQTDPAVVSAAVAQALQHMDAPEAALEDANLATFIAHAHRERELQMLHL